MRNLDVVRQAFDRLEAREPRAAADLCHEEFELTWKGLGANSHAHRGREAFHQHLSDLSRGWDQFRVVCDRLTERGDHVLAMYHLLGHAPGGNRAESPHAAVVRLRDARLSRWDAYQDAAHSFDWLAAEARLAS